MQVGEDERTRKGGGGKNGETKGGHEIETRGGENGNLIRGGKSIWKGGNMKNRGNVLEDKAL